MKLEEILREELRTLTDQLRAQVGGKEQLAIAQMAMDLSMLPIRMARGEDVTDLLASIRAEAQNRALAHRTRAEAAARQAWANVIFRLITAAIV